MDLHVLVHHSLARPRWLEQCLASLQDQPCNVLLITSQSDHIGRLRAAALQLGRAPMVSWVDDDDWLAPGALQSCVDALDVDAAAIGAYTDVVRVDPLTGEQVPRRPTPPWSRAVQLGNPYAILHAKAFRRSALTADSIRELERWPTAEEIVLNALVARHGHWIKRGLYGCYKRQHAGAGSRITPDLLHRAQHLALRAIGRRAA